MTVALRFAEQSAAIDQVATELYRTTLSDVTSRKVGAFRTFLSSLGRAQDMAHDLVLTRDQIIRALDSDMTVSRIKATMIEASDTLGGFLVPEGFHENVVTRLAGNTVVRKRATVMSALTDRLLVPRATGGDSRYPGTARIVWVDEAGLVSTQTTGATFGRSRIPVFLAMAQIDMSRPLLEDGGPLLMIHLETVLSDSFSVDEDERLLVAAGSGTPTGLLPGNTNGHNLAEVNSGAAAALTADGLIDLPFSVAPQYRRRPSVAWAMGTATVKAIARLKDSAGAPLLDFGGADRRNGAPLLGGFVVEEVPDGVLPAIAAGAYPIVFGDFTGVTIADRVGMSVEIHDDSTTAERNAVLITARRRSGGVPIETYKFAVQKVAA